MQNLLRRGATYYARLFIPADRWADVGKAFHARTGIKREVVRTLQTRDIREARNRLRPALAAMQAEIDAKLIAAGKRPLSEWTGWLDHAIALREALKLASDEPVSGEWVDGPNGEEFVGESERDLLLDEIRDEGERIAKQQGGAVAAAFAKAITTEKITIHEAADAWLSEVAPTRRRKTTEGHRRVLGLLERFLRERHGLLSLASTTLDDVTRRIAGEFIQWRAKGVSPAAVRREFSTVMGLWRWAVRRGYTDVNPWTDQTAGISAARAEADDPEKRAFTTAELVVLLRATGDDWSPNGGGYGATLWDATRIGLLTGLRAGELADLRIRDLIENRTMISVPSGKTRNARRIVPLPHAAREVIAARLADLPDTSPDASLWPEIPILSLTGSRGDKLSDRFRLARKRVLPEADGVDLHSLRRSYATMLEDAMHTGGRRINPTLIATLLGHERGTLALDRYSSGATIQALKRAVADMERSIPAKVAAALADTRSQRPRMVRFAPANSRLVPRPPNTHAERTKRAAAPSPD